MNEYMNNVRVFGVNNIIIKDDFNEPFLTRNYLFYSIGEELGNILSLIKLQDIKDLVKTYVENYTDLNCDHYDKPILRPCEPVGKYLFKEYTDDFFKLIEDLKESIIVGYDSSYHNPRGHFLIDFILHNIGYYYEKLGYGEGGSGYHPYIIIVETSDYDLDMIMKNLEIRLLARLLNHIKKRFSTDRIFIFLDESLNLSYTYAWDHNKRKKYGEALKEELNLSISNDAIPIGIFYTRARDILNGLECSLSTKIPFIQDKHLMNEYLVKGSRSQLFRVESDVLDEIGLEIHAFYLKIDENNVIRIEFPSEIIEKYGKAVVDEIHKIVFFDSLRNNGYSYVLARSHEAAVLRYSDREDIERLIAEALNIPLKYVYSRKETFKRRPLA